MDVKQGMQMSVESFLSNKPQSVAGWKKILYNGCLSENNLYTVSVVFSMEAFCGEGKVNFYLNAIHNKFYTRFFFLLLMTQCSSWYMFFGLNTSVIKNSEFTSSSSFGEICICDSIPFLFIFNWSGYSVLLTLDVYIVAFLPFCWLFFVFFSLKLFLCFRSKSQI